MNRNSKYIVMQPPYTLDKWKDGAAQVRTEKEFQELVNYIPCDGSIMAREGVLTLTYTPQSTHTTPFPEDPGEYPIPAEVETARCCLVLRFEDPTTIAYNSNIIKGPMAFGSAMSSVTGSACATTTSNCKEGIGSLYQDINTSRNTKCGNPASFLSLRGGATSLTSLVGSPIWLPGFYNSTYPGTANACLLTAWIYPFTAAGNEETFIEIGNAGSGKAAIVFRVFDDDLQFNAWDSALTSEADENIDNLIVANRWFFVAAWCDVKKGSHGIYMYDDVLQTEKWTADVSNTGRHFYYHCASFTFGGSAPSFSVDGWRNGTDSFNGYIDYITMWDLLFTQRTSNITLIRQIRDLHKAP